MSSGSLKDLSKAITTSSAKLTLPLPDDLLQVITAYVEKHNTPDEADSQRLQEELFNVYQLSFLEHPARLAPFLRILSTLRPVLRGSGRTLQWWDKLSTPVMIHMGVEKGLAIEARDILLEILVFDDEEEESLLEDAELTRDAVADSLLATWLEKTEIAAGECDEHAIFLVKQIQGILIGFGKKRPRDFLKSIDKVIVKKSSRISGLHLLCEFFRHQPPHLHQLLQTPLFENLLQCLQIDTSTRVISLAITALIMFLPHIPISASKHLPALFNIYSRLLFWDRERKSADILPRTDVGTEEESDTPENQPLEDEKTWDKLSFILESEDDTVPELLHYFTFLYGLYPINFMSYIRKPQRYLRHANFPGADDLDIEPTDIRQRSEPFRQVHLLHPNFFTLTIESEIVGNNRWAKSEAADVVAECMALYVPSDEGPQPSRSRGPSKTTELNSDIPDQSLLDSEAVTPYQSRHTSWRNTQSTAVASPEVYRSSGLHRKLSQTSQSMPSIADSPSLHPSDRLDSPTLPPQILGSPSNNRLSDMLSSQRSTRGSLYQALTNDSVGSLSLSNNHQESHVDAYLESLSRDHAPRSPSLRPTTIESVPAIKVAYLQREIQLLKNDLNLERYLKQQHLSHLKRVRNKQIREARAEAETQNLVNSNRTLKAKLEEANRLNLQMKKEHEKSKTHSRKWESELTVKIRTLREESKKWTAEREDLNRDLKNANETVIRLKNMVVESESRELRANQKVASVENSLDELERLRVEVEELRLKVVKLEAGELAAQRAIQNEQDALHENEILEMELRSRDMEIEKAHSAYEQQIQKLFFSSNACFNKDHDNMDAEKADKLKQAINKDMATLRERNTELENVHTHLLNRYNSLASARMDLLEKYKHLEHGLKHYKKLVLGDEFEDDDELEHDDHALLSGGTGGISRFGLHPATPPPQGHRERSIASSESDPKWSPNSGSTSSQTPLIRPSKLVTSFRAISPDGSPTEAPRSAGQIQHFQHPQPYNPPGTSGTGKASIGTDSGSRDSNTNTNAKAKPQKPRIVPEARIHGRGGVQNVGRKDIDPYEDINNMLRASNKKADEILTRSETPEPKKEKKSLGIRGIRGFM